MSDAAPASLPPWPIPTFAEIRDAAGLATLTERLHESGDAAIGLSVHAVGVRSVDADDPRAGTLALVVVARDPARTSPDEPAVAVVDAESIADLGPLLDWLAEDDAPYLVMHDAHQTLARLADRHPDPDGWIPTRVGCTEVAAILLAEGNRPHRDRPDLDECVARALHRALPRPALASASGHDPETLRIAAARADALLPLMRALTPMLRRRELTRVHALEGRLLPAVIAMERAGVGVDGAAFQRIADGWQTERAATTDRDRISRLDKLLSTYAYWPQEFVRGDRIHCRLHPLAADSGRFSCTDPNLQQVPSEHTAPGLRACFKPPPGRALVVADYAQIELRVAAHLAPCDALRRVFREGRDPHRTTAATITGKSEVEVTDHERKLAKAVNFGFLFGMGAARFRSYALEGYGVELDDREARRAREAFLATYPGIAAWHRRVGGLGRRRGDTITVRTALGRRKRFEPGRFSFAAALNIPVQGTAAEGFKLAMIELHPALRRLGGRGVLCVHDEYLAEVPEDRAGEACALVRDTMEQAMATVVDSVPIVVEAAVRPSWG